jgi:hypothetical protein
MSTILKGQSKIEKSEPGFEWLDGTRWNINSFDGNNIGPFLAVWEFLPDNIVRDPSAWKVIWTKESNDKIKLNPLGNDFEITFIKEKWFFVTSPQGFVSRGVKITQ